MKSVKRKGVSLINVMVFMMFTVMITAQVFFFTKWSAESVAEERELVMYRMGLDSIIESALDVVKGAEVNSGGNGGSGGNTNPDKNLNDDTPHEDLLKAIADILNQEDVPQEIKNFLKEEQKKIETIVDKIEEQENLISTYSNTITRRQKDIARLQEEYNNKSTSPNRKTQILESIATHEKYIAQNVNNITVCDGRIEVQEENYSKEIDAITSNPAVLDLINQALSNNGNTSAFLNSNGGAFASYSGGDTEGFRPLTFSEFFEGTQKGDDDKPLTVKGSDNVTIHNLHYTFSDNGFERFSNDKDNPGWLNLPLYKRPFPPMPPDEDGWKYFLIRIRVKLPDSYYGKNLMYQILVRKKNDTDKPETLSYQEVWF